MVPFRFYLITPEHDAERRAPALLPALAEAGLRALQVREKQRTPVAQAAAAQRLLTALGPRRRDLWLFFNDRADLALSLGLDGVQLRGDSLPLERQAPLLRRTLLFGVSTHSMAGVRAAEAAGADFVTFGPVYDTPSKAPYGRPVGVEALARVCAAVRLPVFALGGVTPERARACRAAGAYGVSAIGAIWNAADPVAALRDFGEALGGL